MRGTVENYTAALGTNGFICQTSWYMRDSVKIRFVKYHLKLMNQFRDSRIHNLRNHHWQLWIKVRFYKGRKKNERNDSIVRILITKRQKDIGLKFSVTTGNILSNNGNFVKIRHRWIYLQFLAALACTTCWIFTDQSAFSKLRCLRAEGKSCNFPNKVFSHRMEAQ